MIKKGDTDTLVDRILEYIGDEYKTVPYLFMNIVKYRCGTDNIVTYVDMNNDDILGVYMLYYDCMHFFTRLNDKYPIDEFSDMIKKLNPKVIMVQSAWGMRVRGLLHDWRLERNRIMDMDCAGLEDKEYRSTVADRNDINQIVKILMEDKEYYDVYDEDILQAQLYDRYDSGYSRYFVVKDDGKVVASCSTYGEAGGLAVVGGVITHLDYRRRGLAADVEAYACHILAKSNISRIAFVNFNNDKSMALHLKIGAKPIGDLYKFLRNV